MAKRRLPGKLNELRRKGGKLVTADEEKVADASLTKDFEELTHELTASRIELEMQNEQLRRGQEQLEESRERYIDLYEQAPVGYLTLDGNGIILEINLTGARLLGVERSSLLRKPFLRLIAPESRKAFHLHTRELLRSPGIHRCELKVKRKTRGEEFFYAELESTAVSAADGPVIRSALTDITEAKKAEQKLAEQAFMLANISDAVIALDLQYHITYFSKSAEKMYGYRAGEVLGRPSPEVFRPAYLGITREEVLHRLLATGHVVAEAVHTTKEGQAIIVESHAVLLYDEHGKPKGLIGINRDITDRKRWEKELDVARQQLEKRVEERTADLQADIAERKRVEEALRISEEMFQVAFANNPAAITMARLEDGLLLEVNDTWVAMNGYSREEVIGRSLREMHIWPSPEPMHRFLEELKKKGSLRGWEQEFVKKSGEVFVAQLSSQILTLGGEKVILSALVDITQRKRMEEELRKSHDELEKRVAERTAAVARLAGVVEAATDSIFITDPSWRIAYVNPAFTRYTGYRPDEVIGREMRFLRSEHQDERVYDEMRRAGVEGSLRAERYLIRRKDGTDMTVETTISTLKDASGQIKNFVVVHRDVTRQVQLEEQLHQARKMEAIGTLAGGIAHDFNNMLAVILGNAELILDEMRDGTDSARHQVDQIVKASKRARDLVKQILAFSRKSRTAKRPVVLGSLTKETAKLLRASLPSTVEIEVNVRTDTDAVLADPSQMQQVLMNLATNAADAMHENGGTLTFGVSDASFAEGDPRPDRDMQPGRYVVLTVQDTGTGIPGALHERIFDPFFTTKEAGKGTGMGLPVVYGIVKSHSGAITAESRMGKGSTFKIFLPAYSGPLQEKADEEASPLRGTEKVLIVDDEPSVVEVASATLTRLGYGVTTAGSGPEGWKTFKRNHRHFDLVITDQVMPKMTGMRLAEKILALRSDLPIILFTGHTETVPARKAKAGGIAEFLLKPVTAKELAETVRRVLDGNRDKHS